MAKAERVLAAAILIHRTATTTRRARSQRHWVIGVHLELECYEHGGSGVCLIDAELLHSSMACPKHTNKKFNVGNVCGKVTRKIVWDRSQDFSHRTCRVLFVQIASVAAADFELVF